VSLGRSALEFLSGVLKRFYIWLPSILLDPFDLYDRYLKRYLPERYQFNLDLPTPVFFPVLAVCLTSAAILTYHELRIKVLSEGADEERKRQLTNWQD
jgi:hypothetical protein